MPTLIETVELRQVETLAALAQTAALGMLTNLFGVGGLFEDAELVLFINDASISPGLDPATLDPPTWTGYAPIVATWNAANITGTGSAERVGEVASFGAGSGGDALVYGWALTNDDQSSLYFAKKFDNPVPMTVGQTIHLVVRILISSIS